MEPQGRTIASPFHTRRRGKTFHPSKTTLRIRVHVQAVGLNAKTKNRSALSRRGKFSLDIPFYRTNRKMREFDPGVVSISGWASFRDLARNDYFIYPVEASGVTYSDVRDPKNTQDKEV